MITGDDALLVFIAIFWGSMIGSVRRYLPFETAAAFFSPWSEKHGIFALRRFFVSTFILNLLPIMYLILGYEELKGFSGLKALISAAITSLGIFGCPRILHAIIATESTHKYFFNYDHWKDELQKNRHVNENRFFAHFIPGIMYFICYFAIGVAILRI